MAGKYLDYNRLVQLIENVKRNTIDSSKVADFFIHYVSGNSYKKAADMSGVNQSTAKSWQGQEWYGEVVDCARAVAGQKVDRKLSGLIDLALKNVEDRLVKGDAFKNGSNVDYKPVSAKDSALIAAICYDKRALSRGDPISINETTTFEDRLGNLQTAFQEIAAGKPALKVVEK